MNLENYKASGNEWLPLIPNDWVLKRLKDVGVGIIGLTYSPNDLVDENDGILVLRSSNIQNGKIDFSNNVFVKVKPPKKLITRKGDILICSRNGSRALIGKNICIDKASSGLTFGAFMTVFRTKQYRIVSAFFNSQLFDYQSGAFMTSTINQLTISTLNNLVLAVPPKNHQDIIADYLDRKIRSIDKKILLLQEKINHYVSLNDALVNNAVCRGLEMDIPLKESGIDWIGHIPKHWEIKRLKDVVFINQKSLDENTSPTYQFKYIDIGNIGTSGSLENVEVIDFENAPSRARRIVKRGDVIVSTVRTYLKAIATFDFEVNDIIVSTGFAVLTRKSMMNSIF